MLSRRDAVLVVIDVQERLLPHIHEGERVVREVARLARGCGILDLPILATEQYRKGLGPTDAEVVRALAPDREFAPIEKMTFSCGAHPPFMEALRATGRRQVIVSGIEAHVCVLQTALDLKREGFEVYLAADAVSSRAPRSVEIALRRMEQEGVLLTTVEMAVFEMLHLSGTPEFKVWSQLIR